MEKLLNLLNEYGKTSNCGPFEDYRIEPATDYNSSYLVLQRDDNGEGDWKDWHLDIPRLISKDYGFIDWLVENDKIKDNGIKPRTDLVKEIQIVDYETGKSLGWKNQYSETEQLIMYLSIQDNPIEYLCCILK